MNARRDEAVKTFSGCARLRGGPLRLGSSMRWLSCVLFLLLAAVLGCSQGVVPGARDPGAVTVEAALGSPVLLATGESTVYARLRIATQKRPESERGPVNLVLVMDTSGSMEGAAIVDAKKAAVQMVESLRNGDFLAVVAFDSKVDTLLPSTALDADVKREVIGKIQALTARGTTDMQSGISTGLALANEHFNTKSVNRVILMSDGIPNREDQIESYARNAASRGISITTLGLGLDYDETLMGKIAEISGGRYRYVESSDKLAQFFTDELDQINTVYARQATAVFVPGPGVHIDAVVGGESGMVGTGGYVTLGDIGRGYSRDIVVRLTVKPRKAGVPIELLDATIAFDDALEGAGRVERTVYFGARTTLDEGEVAKAKNPQVDLSAAIAEASATTITALELGKSGQYTRRAACSPKVLKRRFHRQSSPRAVSWKNSPAT
ncbi:MAG: VWA domain-containing protein [Polyangiaceae bacterium]|nr:VWA domain-containing protein [Polyangiaceae bacterium]